MHPNTQQLETLDLPLKKLLAWDDNVRTTVPEQGIEELAASITSVGLLQSLVVKKAARGKYTVVAGRRRLLALSRLQDAGTLPSSFQIPCRVLAHTADSTEIGLTQNVQREPMHPADEFQAFQKLIQSGKTVADVAARFGVSEAVVNKRLALARVSPVLLDKYRAGEMNLELLQAFTLTDDHATQEEIWQDLPPWNRNPQTIRHLLSENDIAAGDKRVRFVGLAHYEAEGGLVKRDLFHDHEHGAYVTDPAKLTRLVNEKLETIATKLKADGWKWIEIQPEADYQFFGRHKRIQARELPLSPETEAERGALEREQQSLQEQIDEAEDEDGSDANEPVYDRLEEIQDRLTAIRRNRHYDYPDSVKATCGAVVGIGNDGQPEFTYGLLRREEEAILVNRTAEANEETDETSPAEVLSPSGVTGYLLVNRTE